MPEEKENGQVVDFPEDEIRMPPTRLPQTIGRMEKGHPLQRPMVIVIIILCVILVVSIIISIQMGPPPEIKNETAGAVSNPEMFSEMYRESGAVTYEDEIIQGWFLDTERQHFMDENGRRFTFVDSHQREDFPVSGHWRLIE